jgi:uncharacterized protein YabE (DUF348 family)
MPSKFEILKVKWARYRRLHLPRQIRQAKAMRRHAWFRVPTITFGVLILVSGIVFLVASRTNNLPAPKDAKIVIVSHDHVQQIVPSKEATVGALLNKLNIKLGQGDVVEPAPNTPVDQDEFRINVYRAVPVEVVDGGHMVHAFSAAKTPRSVAQQAGAALYPEDRVAVGPSQNFLADGTIGQQVVIDRATPVNVDLYGTPVVLRTHSKTVGDLVKEKGIKLEPKDQLVPAPSTPITPGQQISFIRTGTKTETDTETIATPVQKINDPTLAYGTNAVRQQGSDGQQVVTYQISIVNNVETGRTVIQKVVTRAPVTQVMVVGTSLSGIKGDMALAGIDPGDFNYADYIISHESGWNPQAHNASGAYGLCQALPGSKMASAGSDWASNPVTQLRWCDGYARGHYGGWAAAYNHWVAYRNW